MLVTCVLQNSASNIYLSINRQFFFKRRFTSLIPAELQQNVYLEIEILINSLTNRTKAPLVTALLSVASIPNISNTKLTLNPKIHANLEWRITRIPRYWSTATNSTNAPWLFCLKWRHFRFPMEAKFPSQWDLSTIPSQDPNFILQTARAAIIGRRLFSERHWAPTHEEAWELKPQEWKSTDVSSGKVSVWEISLFKPSIRFKDYRNENLWDSPSW